MHYGARVGDSEKFKYYNEIFHRYKELLDQEETIQEGYIDLIINYVNNRSPKSNQHEQAKKVADAVREACNKRDSYQAQLYFFLIELMVQTTVYNYEEALQICEKAITYFKTKSYNADVPLQIFYYQQLVCYIQLGHFEEGQKVTQTSLALASDGSFNWFKYHELYLLLAIQTERYEEAAGIFKKVLSHRRFSFLPENFQEIWSIYQAYLYYLMAAGKISDPSIFHNFKLSRFLNEVLIYSKDKSGLNASVLMVQLLILIVDGRYEDATQRFESVQQYCYRYLKTEYTQRSYLFMKMLLKTIQFSFKKQVVRSKTQKLLVQMEQVPFEVANQAMEIEIIPYETLWKMLLDSLPEK
jgi:tetratricopeptide (TPR) repeat protein